MIRTSTIPQSGRRKPHAVCCLNHFFSVRTFFFAVHHVGGGDVVLVEAHQLFWKAVVFLYLPLGQIQASDDCFFCPYAYYIFVRVRCVCHSLTSSLSTILEARPSAQNTAWSHHKKFTVNFSQPNSERRNESRKVKKSKHAVNPRAVRLTHTPSRADSGSQRTDGDLCPAVRSVIHPPTPPPESQHLLQNK